MTNEKLTLIAVFPDDFIRYMHTRREVLQIRLQISNGEDHANSDTLICIADDTAYRTANPCMHKTETKPARQISFFF